MLNAMRDLPPGWIITSLESLVTNPKSDIVDGPFGSNLKASEYVDSGVPIIRLQNVKSRGFIQKNIRFVDAQKAHELTRHSFVGGDIVISKLGDPLGEACIVPDTLTSGIIVADVVRLRPPAESVDKKYLVHAINSEPVASQLKALTKGTTRPRVNLGHIRSLQIPVAPLTEQRRIVAKIEELFSRLDAGVAALKRVQAALKRYKASVLKAACEGRLVPQDPSDEPADVLLERTLAERRAKWEADNRAKGKDPRKAKYEEPQGPNLEELSELPTGWCWATLGQLSTLITSGSRGWAEFYSETGAVFIRAQDINTDSLRMDHVAHVVPPAGAEGARTRVVQHDLLVTITGANVTKTACVRQDLPEAYVSQHVGLVRLSNPELGAYVYFWIVAPSHGRNALEKAAYGAGKPGLSLVNLNELLVAVPPLTEQTRIVAEIERRISVVDDVQQALEANLTRSERLRQSILARAFSGMLVPHDPADEPAGSLVETIRLGQDNSNDSTFRLANPSRRKALVAAKE